jgi:hypothetical protein
LVESKAGSHFIWFGRDWPSIGGMIRSFLVGAVRPGPQGRR